THGIVEQSAGHIEVDTEVDRGTTFRIFLPTTEEAAAAPRGRAPAAETRGSETVLVVEDEDALRRVAVRILRRGGYQTPEACDGAAALGILGGHPGKVDLVLTDVVMPGMDGRQLAEAVASQYPRTAILYMSGYAGDAVVRRGVRAAEVAFLQKPYTPEAML